MKMDDKAIRAQSESAYKQWAPQWREHAKEHSRFQMKPWSAFENSGIGRPIVCAANGWSLELEMPTLVAMKDQVDILACDKSLGHLIRHGVKPKFVMVCDANVDYEKYLKPYEKELEQTTLFINVCANPQWTRNGNWKDIYFFVNKDILKSEREFSALAGGCPNIMPAGTNVSNAMVILLTQSDNEMGRRNFFGYDKILLIGFDYCWRHDGNYYAYSKDGNGKSNYMRHIYCRTIGGSPAFTSTNLAFSAVWLGKYCEAFNLPVVQCSKESVFLTRHKGVLSEQMRYSFKKEDSAVVRESVKRIADLSKELAALKNQMRNVSFEHHMAVLRSI